MDTHKSYIICTTPRSGSTLLCKLLAATGCAGNPDSHFHRPSLANWIATYGLIEEDFASDREALAAIFAAAYQRGKGPTDIFGLRLQRGSFDFFMQKLSQLYPEPQSDLERIRTAFGHTLFIYLTRPNKLDQAISRVKAEQTGLWHKAPDGTEIERMSPPKAPYYDAAGISHHLADLNELEMKWAAWFEKEKIRPLCISYDDLSVDPIGSLTQILGKLGLDRKMPTKIEMPTARLSDEDSRAWAKRFRDERAS